MSETKLGSVLGVAFRPTRREALQGVSECEVEAGRGLVNEERNFSNRQLTLLSNESWTAVCKELDVELDWLLRRANLLVDEIDLEAALGKKVSIGEVEALIHGETKPCGLMDYQYKGLRAALTPRFRGGVFAEVLRGGTIRVGDSIEVRD